MLPGLPASGDVSRRLESGQQGVQRSALHIAETRLAQAASYGVAMALPLGQRRQDAEVQDTTQPLAPSVIHNLDSKTT